MIAHILFFWPEKIEILLEEKENTSNNKQNKKTEYTEHQKKLSIQHQKPQNQHHLPK